VRNTAVKVCFHYGCAALRVAKNLRAIVSDTICSDMSRYIALRYSDIADYRSQRAAQRSAAQHSRSGNRPEERFENE